MSPAPTPTAITETMRPCNAPAYYRTFDPPGEFPLDDSKRLCVHLLEKAIASLPEGGETLVGIFDLRGFGNRNADLGFVRFLVRKWPDCRVNHGKLQLHQYKPVWIEHPSQAFGVSKAQSLCCSVVDSVYRLQVDIFFTYYPKRLGQVVMVDAPFMFKPG